MTPWRGDPRAAVPLAVAAATTLVHPARWRWFVSGSVAAYALTPAAGPRSRRTSTQSRTDLAETVRVRGDSWSRKTPRDSTVLVNSGRTAALQSITDRPDSAICGLDR
jgi:hypothetical protein